MDEEIENIADEERYKDKVDRLVCFKGIDTQTALTLVVEIGDFERFATAEQFASYIGLVPGEDSSGQKKRIGSITKEGNSRVRLVLTEAAKSIKRSSPFGKSKRIIARQKGQSPDIVAYADRGSKRIRQKMARMGSAWQEQERIYNSRSKGACVLRMGNDDRQYCLRQIEARERT